MISGAFAAGDWIDRLAGALPELAEAQERYLSGYREIRLLSHLAPGVHANGPPEFPLGDVRELYARARHSHMLGEREHYRGALRGAGPGAAHSDGAPDARAGRGPRSSGGTTSTWRY